MEIIDHSIFFTGFYYLKYLTDKVTLFFDGQANPFGLTKIIISANRCHIKRIKLLISSKKEGYEKNITAHCINPDKYAMEFLCYLGRLTKSKVTGVLLKNLAADEKPVLKQMQGMESMADSLMKEVKLLLFIAHN